jgi:hypothetical protein
LRTEELTGKIILKTTMSALVYEGPRQMNIRQVPIPDIQPDEVLIRVVYSGICGSELSGYEGKNSLRRPPLIMGHELSGTIEAVGSNVQRPELMHGVPVTANLLDNAAKFSPEDAPIEIAVSSPTAQTVTISVTDSGVGIPPEHRQQLFSRFYQAHGEGYKGGMGLGLYISSQIITLHGGEIRPEFPLAGGTRFIITLPVSVASAKLS